MEVWSVRAAQLLLFFFLLSERHGPCAALGEEGRAMGFREERPSGSLWNLGEKKVFGASVTFLVKGNKLSIEIPNELQERIMISEVLTDGRQQLCRKCLTKTIRSTTLRQLLQARELQESAPSSKATNQPHKSQPPMPSPPSHSQAETNESSSVLHWTIYALCVSGALGLVVIATVVYLLVSRRKKDNTVNPWATGLSGQLRKAFVTGVPSLGRAELEAACENFSNVIGTVSDSALYKGTLSSGVEIAVASSPVKSAKEWSDRSEEQFRNKISVLSKVNHKNFMNLLGYCTCDDPFTRMMVFEYAPCGSLFEHLHVREAEHLDWPTRLRIIMGVTYCLEHMNQLDPPVTPRTLNSSSIYLTEDYAAKFSDTEFWKDDDGDVAPTRSAGQDSIVYKFGILLLEVISGRLPFSEDHGLLVLWASSYLDGKRLIGSMADPVLRASSPVPEGDLAALCDVVRLCINREAAKRPSMGEVAGLMKGAVGLSPEQTTPRNNPLWWAELEIMSTAST
ncbi:protein MALE DISCOVERER 2-like [Triticum dicoccoides]|uniref:protein MALE DISCOVERER 2-like n=1 Tax=Triticum dicoccoides TaxID=85692 RepID=UPI000E78E5B7|nr:protein MALE DISCOVERER 2-like [Triticum dicoccoides]XP_037440547.1 protein MALE DISCOVERER 2-like [Triticum dicoccoides]